MDGSYDRVFKGISILFPIVFGLIYISTNGGWEFHLFLFLLLHLLLIMPLILAILTTLRLIINVVLIRTYLVAKEV